MLDRSLLDWSSGSQTSGMYPRHAMIARDKEEPREIELVCIIHTDRLVEQVAKKTLTFFLGLWRSKVPGAGPSWGRALEYEDEPLASEQS